MKVEINGKNNGTKLYIFPIFFGIFTYYGDEIFFQSKILSSSDPFGKEVGILTLLKSHD